MDHDVSPATAEVAEADLAEEQGPLEALELLETSTLLDLDERVDEADWLEQHQPIEVGEEDYPRSTA